MRGQNTEIPWLSMEGQDSLVRMFPGINAQQRLELADHRILICIRPDPNLSGLRILHKPSPPATLNAGQFCIEDLLQAIEVPVGLPDFVAERSNRTIASTCICRGKVLPEKRVVDMPTAMEVEERLQRELLCGVRGGLRGRGGGCESGEFFEGSVVGVHVGGMMFAVVKLHDLARDGGF